MCGNHRLIYSHDSHTFLSQILWREQRGVKECGNYRNSLSHFFDKNVLKATVSVKWITNTQCHNVERREILSHQKIFRQINSLLTPLVKPLISRNFCKKLREKFRNFHTAQCGKMKNLLSLAIIFRQNIFRKMMISSSL